MFLFGDTGEGDADLMKYAVVNCNTDSVKK